MRKQTETVDDLTAASIAAEALVRILEDLRKKRKKLMVDVQKIQALPMHLHARLWYRDKRYAYVHSHPPGGERVKQYVGTDTKKIREATAAIERGTLFLKLTNDIACLDRDLSGLRGTIESERRRAHDVFTGQQRMPAHRVW